MPAIVTSEDEEIQKVIEETAKKTAELTKIQLVDELKDGKSKISEIVKNASSSVIQQQRSEQDKEREKLEKELEQSEVPCPTCSHGEHKHKLKPIGNGKLECTDNGCRTVYSLIPDEADFKCTKCDKPHKKPISKELQDKDSCPFCGGNDFLKFDWNKYQKNVNKK